VVACVDDNPLDLSRLLVLFWLEVCPIADAATVAAKSLEEEEEDDFDGVFEEEACLLLERYPFPEEILVLLLLIAFRPLPLPPPPPCSLVLSLSRYE
jgi:hypothetical protein